MQLGMLFAIEFPPIHSILPIGHFLSVLAARASTWDFYGDSGFIFSWEINDQDFLLE